MIHFGWPPEPLEFDKKCRQPGNRWLKDHPDAARPRDYWTAFKSELADGFSDLCGYTVMYTPNGTVDHYLSCKNYSELIYEWSNYRFAAGWINSSKKTTDNTILDPFEVEDGWFQILLPSLQMVITDDIPNDLRKKAQFTLERLHLRDDERVIRQRREWLRMYQSGELTLDGLSKKAPLIAAAIRKQQNAEA